MRAPGRRPGLCELVGQGRPRDEGPVRVGDRSQHHVASEEGHRRLERCRGQARAHPRRRSRRARLQAADGAPDLFQQDDGRRSQRDGRLGRARSRRWNRRPIAAKVVETSGCDDRTRAQCRVSLGKEVPVDHDFTFPAGESHDKQMVECIGKVGAFAIQPGGNIPGASPAWPRVRLIARLAWRFRRRRSRRSTAGVPQVHRRPAADAARVRARSVCLRGRQLASMSVPMSGVAFELDRSRIGRYSAGP